MPKKYKAKLIVNSHGVFEDDKIFKVKVYAQSVEQAIYFARKEIMNQLYKYRVGYKEIEVISIKRIK